MVFGTDHPNGAWKSRHDVPAAHMIAPTSSDVEKPDIQTTVIVAEADKPETGKGASDDEGTSFTMSLAKR